MHRLFRPIRGWLLALASTVLFTPVPGLAQAYDISGLPKGYTVRWETDAGGTDFVYQGRVLGGFKGTFTRDATAGKPLRMTVYMTRTGESKQYISKEFNVRFIPHDCFLTAGSCSYREELSDGRYRLMRRTAIRDGNSWNYKLYRKYRSRWELEEEGRYTVDKYGYVINRDFTYDGEKRWTRRKPD